MPNSGVSWRKTRSTDSAPAPAISAAHSNALWRPLTIVPEDNLYTEGITFVRLGARPDEQSRQPVNVVVTKDSKVALLTARVATGWPEGSAAGPSTNSKGLIDDAGGFGVAADTD